ncbi:trypsin domain-containing protein [Ditylenchus destructor]|nr:trypsin domain-containing protein [Ditylenchus destructor]
MFPIIFCVLTFLPLFTISNAELECGISEHPFPPPGHRVINGTLVQKGELPWLTAIRIQVGEKAFLCTGSIISRNHVLFAAHCYEPEATYIMKFGTEYAHDKHALTRTTEKAHIHEKYTFPWNDIAILEFDEPLDYDENIRPICLKKTFNESKNKKPALTSGYGGNRYYKRPPAPPGAQDGKLRRGSEAFITPKQCKEEWPGEMDTKVCLCTKGLNDTDTMEGDSGGPISIQNPKRSDGKVQWMQVGICSFGPDGYRIAPSAYTRLSVYCDWIAKTTKNAAKCRD